MPDFVLRVSEDRIEGGGGYGGPLPALNRVLYVLRGGLTVTDGGAPAPVTENGARHSAGPCRAAAGGDGATVLRYELLRAGGPPAPVPGIVSRLLLEHPIELDPTASYLMRCDRVDFALGGEALPHRHQGGGIRCLISGTIELQIGDQPPRTIRPGQAWFESGREPVHAIASREAATSFIRCSILPRAIRGRSSILYVDPADAASGRPRQYTVFVDDPIDLP